VDPELARKQEAAQKRARLLSKSSSKNEGEASPLDKLRKAGKAIMAGKEFRKGYDNTLRDAPSPTLK
jgi:hypothetical protein